MKRYLGLWLYYLWDVQPEETLLGTVDSGPHCESARREIRTSVLVLLKVAEGSSKEHASAQVKE